jgi:hypothetical protein
MKGFKLLEAKLADSEEKLRSTEQAYVALEEKARSEEASHTERVSKLEEKICSHETVHAEIIFQAREKIRIDAETYAAEVSQMEEKLRASESVNSKLSEKLQQCEKALNSLFETIQRSVTCGICQFVPTQPCRYILTPLAALSATHCLFTVLTAVTSFARCVCSVGGKLSKRPAVPPVEWSQSSPLFETPCKGLLDWHAPRLANQKYLIHLIRKYSMASSHRRRLAEVVRHPRSKLIEMIVLASGH